MGVAERPAVWDSLCVGCRLGLSAWSVCGSVPPLEPCGAIGDLAGAACVARWRGELLVVVDQDTATLNCGDTWWRVAMCAACLGGATYQRSTLSDAAVDFLLFTALFVVAVMIFVYICCPMLFSVPSIHVQFFTTFN